MQLVFKKLPVDARARAALVCRTWRDSIAEPAVWTEIDLTLEQGITVDVTDAVLRGAVARAQGQLEVLWLGAGRFSVDTVVEVLTAQQGTLRQLCWHTGPLDSAFPAFLHVEQVARAVPRLADFYTDVQVSSVVDATRMLRKDPPFQALHLCALSVTRRDAETSDADVLSLVAAVSAHHSLKGLVLRDVSLRTTSVLDSLAAAVTACELLRLYFFNAGLSQASQPAILRLLRAGKLQALGIQSSDEALLDASGAAEIADAIRASRTIWTLELTHARLWRDPAVTAAIMRAVTRHPSLRVLKFQADAPPDQAAAGAALCVLCAADSPSLETLSIRSLSLGDAGMRPLLGALAYTRHLRVLDCSNTGMSEEFARDVFLPAIRANTSLRKLTARVWWGDRPDGIVPPAVLEAEALVAARCSEGGGLST